MTHRRSVLSAFLSLVAILPAGRATATAAARPNIVLIYADDLGYGDVGCYGATRVRTPNIDRLAREGLRFTDAHAPSSTCTPSRYALLTGEYAWRRKGTAVLPGDAALIIEPGRTTLPAILKRAGYATGVVGKWHLGLGAGSIDWNGAIRPGPLEVGFDESFIMAATGDRVPCVYLRGHRVVGLDPRDPIRVGYGRPIGAEPTGAANPRLLKVKPSHGHDQTIVNGISRIGSMSGGRSARWVDEDMADAFTREAVAFIERRASAPFFLYFATHDIHVPRVPHPRFAGKSGCGVRGDVVQELDWCVGQVLDALDRLKLTDRTLIVFTSDNGPVVDDGYADGAVRDLDGHRPAGPLRGGKYSLFEGGTRVPFLVRWPGRVQPGVSEALVNQVDLLASVASLAGQAFARDSAPDSFDVLPALLGDSRVGRDYSVHHSGRLALRQGEWKYIPAGPGPAVQRNTNTETGNAPVDQLYDLAHDLGETQNVAAEHPDRVRAMAARLRSLRAAGRSRP
jgi:arylsulfatase A-like enzyme